MEIGLDFDNSVIKRLWCKPLFFVGNKAVYNAKDSHIFQQKNHSVFDSAVGTYLTSLF